MCINYYIHNIYIYIIQSSYAALKKTSLTALSSPSVSVSSLATCMALRSLSSAFLGVVQQQTKKKNVISFTCLSNEKKKKTTTNWPFSNLFETPGVCSLSASCFASCWAASSKRRASRRASARRCCVCRAAASAWLWRCSRWCSWRLKGVLAKEL